MAVIPPSLLALSRARRELAYAFESGDWQALMPLDNQLSEAVVTAAQDPDKHSVSLLEEMGRVLSLYKKVIRGCQFEVQQLDSDHTIAPQ